MTYEERFEKLEADTPASTGCREWSSWGSDALDLIADVVAANTRGWAQAEEFKRAGIKTEAERRQLRKDIVVEVSAARTAFSAMEELIKLAGGQFDPSEWLDKFEEMDKRS